MAMGVARGGGKKLKRPVLFSRCCRGAVDREARTIGVVYNETKSIVGLLDQGVEILIYYFCF